MHQMTDLDRLFEMVEVFHAVARENRISRELLRVELTADYYVIFSCTTFDARYSHRLTLGEVRAAVDHRVVVRTFPMWEKMRK